VYKGGASIKVNVMLANGSEIPMQVFVSEFTGTIRLRLPHKKWNDMISVSFVRDPGVTFRVDAPITVQKNEMLRGMVNKALSAVMRRVFLDLWVMPSARSFYLPFLEPKDEVCVSNVRLSMKPEKLSLNL
jgi:hypothetical protein